MCFCVYCGAQFTLTQALAHGWFEGAPCPYGPNGFFNPANAPQGQGYHGIFTGCVGWLTFINCKTALAAP